MRRTDGVQKIKTRNFDIIWNHYSYQTDDKILDLRQLFYDQWQAKSLKNEMLQKRAKNFLFNYEQQKNTSILVIQRTRRLTNARIWLEGNFFSLTKNF